MVNSYFTIRTEWLIFVTKRYHLKQLNRINENCNIWYSRLYCFFIACLAELRCFNCQTELAYPRACPFVRKCNAGEVGKLIPNIIQLSMQKICIQWNTTNSFNNTRNKPDKVSYLIGESPFTVKGKQMSWSKWTRHRWHRYNYLLKRQNLVTEHSGK